MSDSTDAALSANGDYQAFERLYRRYLSRVYSLCARLSGEPTKAEKLTEEVFVTTWEELPRLRGESAFAPWLHRLATDVVLNRRDNGRPVAVGQESSAIEVWEEVVATAHEGERLDLSQAIDLLPAGARRIIVLHDVEGYKHEDIAEILGITAGGSKARLNRARVLLREVMG